MYDKELYAIIKLLSHWNHYLLANAFTLFIDHKALRFLNNQDRLKDRHASLAKLLSSFHFVLMHKVGAKTSMLAL